MDDAKAERFQVGQNAGQGAGGRGVDVVEQDDALAPGLHVGDDALVQRGGVAGLEVAAVDVDREGGDLPAVQVAQGEGGIPEIGEAEERGDRLAERLLHGAEAQLDLRLRLVLGQAIKLDVRPRVRGDGVALGATSFTVSGSESAMRPTMKKVALVQWEASVSRIGRV